MLATESLKLVTDPMGSSGKDDAKYLANWTEYLTLAEIY